MFNTVFGSEVENDRRVSLAAEGFGFGSVGNELYKSRKLKSDRPSIPTAASLLNKSKMGRCIFVIVHMPGMLVLRISLLHLL